MVSIEMTMRSCALDMDTKVNILLPEDRHKTVDLKGKKYPVLYILRGMKEDNSSWLNLSNIFLMCRDLDLIVVMPSVQKSFYSDQVSGLNYFTYIVDELPLKLKNYFPISDKQEDTFIMGESMGGYGTLKAALSRPQQYGKAVCLSGSNIATMDKFNDLKFFDGNFGSKEELINSDNNLDVLVEKLRDYKGQKPEFKFYCGTEDFVYESCLAFYLKLKEEKDLKVSGEFFKGVHNFFFWNEAIPKALKFFGFDVKENDVI